jgi:hypothetical protein
MRLEGELDQFGAVLGDGATGSDHDGDWVAHQPNDVAGQCGVDGRDQAVGPDRAVRCHAFEVGPGPHAEDAVECDRGRRVDRPETPVRDRTAHERGMHHAARVGIGDEMALSGEKAAVLDPRYSGPDEPAHGRSLER